MAHLFLPNKASLSKFTKLRIASVIDAMPMLELLLEVIKTTSDFMLPLSWPPASLRPCSCHRLIRQIWCHKCHAPARALLRGLHGGLQCQAHHQVNANAWVHASVYALVHAHIWALVPAHVHAHACVSPNPCLFLSPYPSQCLSLCLFLCQSPTWWSSVSCVHARDHWDDLQGHVHTHDYARAVHSFLLSLMLESKFTPMPRTNMATQSVMAMLTPTSGLMPSPQFMPNLSLPS